MPRRKVLKSVVRSVADSFVSNMNYRDGDYVMGHLLNAAIASGETTLRVNLVTGAGAPPVLMAGPVGSSVASYVADFPDLIRRSGSDPVLVKTASLEVAFDPAIRRPVGGDGRYLKSPYTCRSIITDDRGRVYEAVLKGWDFSERDAVQRPRRSSLRRWFRRAT